MPYDPLLVQPMRDELTRIGFTEMLTPADVDSVLSQPGTTFVVVNSVCGCAAGSARPAVAMALQNKILPDRLATVFAGQDVEATQHLRTHYLPGIPPSSPSMALFRDGQPVAVIHRHHIEGRMPETIAEALKELFNEYCIAEPAA
ncbi:MAG: BrxA/BrxB family bacilliredoxin [Bacteroidota bacterium]|nr:BrxA/BrxB family bacilliredoxin [Candidatus Kapabacteria bacterium]MDW8220495.1 BrxA/BrxB family bacilliredoxin [Bacteroidota bacterium]